MSAWTIRNTSRLSVLDLVLDVLDGGTRFGFDDRGVAHTIFLDQRLDTSVKAALGSRQAPGGPRDREEIEG